MKRKKHPPLYYISVWFLLIFFSITSFSLIITQTYFGKKAVKNLMIDFAKKNNIELKIDKLGGVLPFEYKLKNTEVSIEDNIVKIENLKFRIEFWPLLRKKLIFKTFKASNIEFVLTEKQKFPNKKDQKNPLDSWPRPNIDITFKSIKIKDLKYTINNEKLILALKGNFKIKKRGKDICFEFDVERKDYSSSEFNIKACAYKKDLKFDCTIKAKSDTLKAYFIEPKYDISFETEIHTRGSLNTYLAYLNKTSPKYPIKGYVKFEIFEVKDHLTKPVDALVNRNTKIDFEYLSKEDLSLSLYDVYIKNDVSRTTGNLTLSKNMDILKSNLLTKIEDISFLNYSSKIPVYGSYISTLAIENKNVKLDFKIDDFHINNFHLIDFKGNISADFAKDSISGNTNISSYAFNQPLNINTNFDYKNKYLDFSNFEMTAPSSKLTADLNISPNFFITGNAKMHFDDLSQMRIFVPKVDFNATADVNFAFSPKTDEEKTQQIIEITSKITDYYIYNFFGKTCDLISYIENPFFSPKGTLSLNLQNTSVHDLTLNTISIETSTLEENHPFAIECMGTLKDPISINAYGFWSLQDELKINLQDFNGISFNNPYSLDKPTDIEISKDKFILKDFLVNMQVSSVYADINLSKNSSKAKITCEHLPLDFLSINPLDLDVTGYATMKLNLEEGLSKQGNLDLYLDDLNISSLTEETPLKASGTLKASLDKDTLKTKSSIKIKNKEVVFLDSKIPIDFEFFPLKFAINKNKTLYANFDYNGKVEEILDFINLGPQNLQGDLKTNLTLTGSLNKPNVKGFCHFNEGVYENYYLGTYLQDIKASIFAENENLTLKMLTASDDNQGGLAANGNYSLNKKKHYPFNFKIELDDLKCVQTEMVNSKATADIEISGNLLSSLAKGSVKLNETILRIPEKLPVTIPTVNEKFIRHPFQKELPAAKLIKAIYPINLDFKVDLENPIVVKGSGLNSTWRGNITLGGSYMNLETNGLLTLDKGEYVFSGRHFDLTKGTVTFTGKPNALPLLDVKAKMKQQGVDIIANVEGPLSTPKIKFTSEPPLPASSIISLLLFGQEVSDLSETQTIELANTMSQKLDESQLASSDPSSSLGIDRFSIVSYPSQDPDKPDQMAVQFGKYITRNIVVSFSQGLEQGSSNIIVELDLTKGFIFQAETQQQEEQGKFSLKWRHNY